MMRWRSRATLALAFAMPVLASFAAHAQQQKPNFVIIWGDDIGQSNVSAYTNGLMGYRTPNIDLIAQQVPAQAYVRRFLSTFKDYPPRQKAASFSIDQVMESLQQGGR
jgi:hypothetical protein